MTGNMHEPTPPSKSKIVARRIYTRTPHESDRRSDRRCVKLRRILSPQADSPSDCITSRTLIVLFCRECSDASCSSCGSGRVSYVEDVVCARSRRGDSDGLMLDHSVVGELAAEIWPRWLVLMRGR